MSFNINEIRTLLTAFDGCTTPEVKNLLIKAIRASVAGSDTIMLTSNEIQAGINVGKVAAVKMYLERLGLSILESKIAVEKYFTDHDHCFKSLIN